MSEDFRSRLVAHAGVVLGRAERALTEAATQQYLILPFFQFLGYDPLNPDEIIPQAQASFSDKFPNRVDYAICIDGKPAIAVECKCAGRLKEANRGEIKGYFNAVPSVRLGILTDGLIYELYSDTGRENMMDDEPFTRVDLAEVAKGRIAENALDALVKLQKGTFDPADVGADAKRKIYVTGYVSILEANFRQPSEPLVRLLMDLAAVDGRRTNRLLEEHAPMITEAVRVFLDKKILERVGFAERQDLVRMDAGATSKVDSELETTIPPTAEEAAVETTAAELSVYSNVKNRLSFLVTTEELFSRLEHVQYVDRKTLFTVFYRQERKGRLFNLREGKEGVHRFEFADGAVIETADLRQIDEALLSAYKKRVEELG